MGRQMSQFQSAFKAANATELPIRESQNIQDFENGLKITRDAFFGMISAYECELGVVRKEIVIKEGQNKELCARVETLEERLEEANRKISEMIRSVQKLQQFKQQVYESFIEDNTVLSEIVKNANSPSGMMSKRVNSKSNLTAAASSSSSRRAAINSITTSASSYPNQTLKTSIRGGQHQSNPVSGYDTASDEVLSRDLYYNTRPGYTRINHPGAGAKAQLVMHPCDNPGHSRTEMIQLPSNLTSGGLANATAGSAAAAVAHSYGTAHKKDDITAPMNPYFNSHAATAAAGSGGSGGVSMLRPVHLTSSSLRGNLGFAERVDKDADEGCGGSSNPRRRVGETITTEFPGFSRLLQDIENKAPGCGVLPKREAPQLASETGSSTLLSQNHLAGDEEAHNKVGGGSGGSGGGSSTYTVDGRDFFKLARSKLSYDEFTQLLNNVKSFNARSQSRQRTLENLEQLFGDANRELYHRFSRIINYAPTLSGEATSGSAQA